MKSTRKVRELPALTAQRLECNRSLNLKSQRVGVIEKVRERLLKSKRITCVVTSEARKQLKFEVEK